MSRPPTVPSEREMQRYLEKGMTQAQIATAWEKETGIGLSRSAIAMAIQRYGLKSAHERPRYEDLLPWRVRQRHTTMMDARMLRLYGRLREGGSVSERERRMLESWLRDLRDAKAVVTYDPATVEGFHWTPRKSSDGPDSLIRQPKGRVRK